MSEPDPVLIFHAGFHKTGTTSLQTALRLHSAALAPHIAVQTRATHAGLRAAADAARDLSAATTPEKATPLATPQAAALANSLAHWAASLSSKQSLLVSCEDFAGHMPGRFGIADYRAVRPIAAAIRGALRLHRPAHRLSFLFTTRAADPWLRALHWQLSKHDDMVQGPNRFARAHVGAAGFAMLLDALRADLPDTPILSADLESLGPRRLGPVEAMYDAANLPQPLRDSLPTPPHVNQSPPHDLARVFVRLNRSDLPRAEIRRLKRDMLAAESLLLGERNLFAFPVDP